MSSPSSSTAASSAAISGPAFSSSPLPEASQLQVASGAHFDVVIIGSGAGGGTLARHLAPTGLKVLVLERGDWLPQEPQNWDADAVFQQNRYVSTDPWLDKHGKAFQPGSHYFVGGATKMYGAAHFRLRQQDFEQLLPGQLLDRGDWRGMRACAPEAAEELESCAGCANAPSPLFNGRASSLSKAKA